MGYRSEVGLVLTRAGVDVLNKKLAGPEVSEETRKEVESLLAYAAHHYTDSESGAEVWLWDWIKWYPDYQDIALLGALMNELEDEDYRFIRIGEEYDDIEVRGGFWKNPFGLELNRSIELGEAG